MDVSRVMQSRVMQRVRLTKSSSIYGVCIHFRIDDFRVGAVLALILFTDYSIKLLSLEIVVIEAINNKGIISSLIIITGLN